ncbi:MAG: hypothetical protein A4E72_01711 [Syntrophus sp. PtaU1.Bin208]|nr:MAG: hypothetical protein A4E72_01711 [Syntrophus sp. PtaU1.Bin208]
MTHAGAWLLAKDIRKFTISADVACALFLGSDKVRILDRRNFEHDVYSMIDEVVVYILSKINVEYIIKHVKREERPELPEEALREAVVNALAHRDYRSTANVQVYIFKDRVEIVSPGGLPAGMTEADLGIKSIPRNPLLFGMLHRMEAVEHIGSGIKRIRNLCREYGVAEPRIEVAEHWFTVIFPRTSSDAGHQVGTKLAPSQSQVAILKFAGEARPISDFMTLIGRADRTKFRNQVIKPLIEAGWLEMTIPDKPTSSIQKYRLTAQGKELLHGIEGGES